jgi:YfiH family protein
MLTTGFFENSSGKQIAKWAFSDRDGGKSAEPYTSLNLATHVGDSSIAVAFNRSLVLAEFGYSDVTWPGPVHGTDIGLVEKSSGLFPDVDGLITKRRETVLATLGADCVPLIAVDVDNKIALTAHIGWKGAASEIHATIFDAVENLGGNLKTTKVVLGPAICGNCYKVDQSRIDEVSKVLPAAKFEAGLDIRSGLKEVFKSKVQSVELVGECTFESAQLFSHRRDGITGRQAGFVVLL